ncbi:ABC transporter substrate-binding protein [Paenibacillus sp. GCM10027629]|uniref:ABC transporter substrate-binding protein n=1 Tax=Paenibacillus sp. GCM10027629 TaxID=3273414 RepID=UPI0036314826
MKKTRKFMTLLLVATCMMTMLLSACGSTKTADAPKETTEAANDNKTEPAAETTAEPDNTASTEPVTIKFMTPWGGGEGGEVRIRLADALEKKYPNIKIEAIGAFASAEKIQEANAANNSPDIMLITDPFVTLNDLEMTYPLDDLIAKNNVDMTKFRDGAIEAIRQRDPEQKNRLLGMPIEDVVVNLFYNKDIFDKLGLEYPSETPTWDELLDLAKKIAGKHGDAEYVGLATRGLSQAMLQLSASGTNPETGEILFEKDPKFAKYFSLVQRVVSIPGNVPDEAQKDNFGFEKGNVGMILSFVNSAKLYAHTEGLNFGMSAYPSWSDLPGVLPNNIPLTLAINPASKHIEEAFKVLEFAASEENQKNIAIGGAPPVVKDPEIRKYLAGDDKVGVYNIDVAYKGTAAAPVFSPYGPDIFYYESNIISDKTAEMIKNKGKEDVNTFLRKMTDEYAAILKEKANKK